MLMCRFADCDWSSGYSSGPRWPYYVCAGDERRPDGGIDKQEDHEDMCALKINTIIYLFIFYSSV